MPLSNRQRHALQQMGISVWQRRDAGTDEITPHWLSGTGEHALSLLLLSPQRPGGSWLDDLLRAIDVPQTQVAWLPAAQCNPTLLARWQPRLCLALEEASAQASLNWPRQSQLSPRAKREQWLQLRQLWYG